jgi:osmoprotectant transport system ATP-binding protein
VSRLTGTGDRALKQLSLTRAADALEPGVAEGPAVAASASLREVLSELVWSGANSATVRGTDGSALGQLSIARILALGRHG